MSGCVGVILERVPESGVLSRSPDVIVPVLANESLEQIVSARIPRWKLVGRLGLTVHSRDVRQKRFRHTSYGCGSSNKR